MNMLPRRSRTRSERYNDNRVLKENPNCSSPDAWTPARRHDQQPSNRTSTHLAAPQSSRCTLVNESDRRSGYDPPELRRLSIQDRQKQAFVESSRMCKSQQQTVLQDSPSSPQWQQSSRHDQQQQQQLQLQKPRQQDMHESEASSASAGQSGGRRQQAKQKAKNQPPPLGGALADHFAVFQACRRGSPQALRHDLYAKVCVINIFVMPYRK